MAYLKTPSDQDFKEEVAYFQLLFVESTKQGRKVHSNHEHFVRKLEEFLEIMIKTPTLQRKALLAIEKSLVGKLMGQWPSYKDPDI